MGGARLLIRRGGKYPLQTEGCSYLNAWSGVGAPAPTEPCTRVAKSESKMKRTLVKASVPTPTPRVG